MNEGLLALRKKFGEQRFAELSAISDEMRALFESDPVGTTGDGQTGRKIIREMEEILKGMLKRAPK